MPMPICLSCTCSPHSVNLQPLTPAPSWSAVPSLYVPVCPSRRRLGMVARHLVRRLGCGPTYPSATMVHLGLSTWLTLRSHRRAPSCGVQCAWWCRCTCPPCSHYTPNTLRLAIHPLPLPFPLVVYSAPSPPTPGVGLCLRPCGGRAAGAHLHQTGAQRCLRHARLNAQSALTTRNTRRQP